MMAINNVMSPVVTRESPASDPHGLRRALGTRAAPGGLAEPIGRGRVNCCIACIVGIVLRLITLDLDLKTRNRCTVSTAECGYHSQL